MTRRGSPNDPGNGANVRRFGVASPPGLSPMGRSGGGLLDLLQGARGEVLKPSAASPALPDTGRNDQAGQASR